MNLDLVYVKTEKGRNEIAHHSEHLPARLRVLLIMVDGVKPLRAVLAQRGNTPDGPAQLEQLEAMGLIEVRGSGTPASTPAPVTAPEASSAVNGSATGALNIKAGREAAVRLLHEVMGPDADHFAMKLERCLTGEELLAHVQNCANLVGNSSGKAAADKYLASVQTALKGS
jgi:hypothetical protein